MKKYLILMALVLTGTIAKADDYALKVTLHEGGTSTYVLGTKPVISCSGENVTIKNGTLEDSYSIKDIKSMSFVKDMASVGEVVPGNTTYDFRGNVFACEGHEIIVVNLRGQAVATGTDSVSLEALDNGIYIVNTGDRAIKVIKN